ncbi:Signal peptide peptidase 1 [Pseudocercospora fuligena]|uniref:Signal peptide peptidase 1 n=1 Tax=Pseudocercospora fuligena TaxID=685502 RepID=A0A8H6RGV3_9PEZI|nr:Signal peptide peptidase 1 [Pseudocercospora fuligena]
MDNFVEAAAYHFEQNRPLIPVYIHLLVAALFPIYIGAHASLSRPSSAAKPSKRTEQDQNDDDEEEETVQKMEGLTPTDAIIFPVTAGLVLATLYWLIKTYGASVINTVLGIYFGLIGTFSVAKLINDTLSTVAGVLMPGYYADQGKLWKVSADKHEVMIASDANGTKSRSSPFAGIFGRLPLPSFASNVAWWLRDLVFKKFEVKGYAKNLFDFKIIMTQNNALSAILGVAAIVYSFVGDKPWWLTNLQGFAVSYGALQLMSPTTFATGTLILSGLFFYDIWAVFFTPLMVTVAKNLDVPIKLVFPRPDSPPAAPGEAPKRSYSMLGLGDIVLPGLMIALALRFDLYMFYLRKQKKVQKCEGDICTLETEKAPYVTVTGHWGDKLWTRGVESALLPAQLSASFPKPYFTVSVVGYIIGMLATLIFMSVFQHAQPALLYLVPGVLTSVWGTALIRGEVKEVWAYSEAITGEANDDAESSGAPEEKKESKGLFADLWDDLFGSSEKKEDKKSADAEESKDNSKPPPEVKTSREESSIFSLSIEQHKRKSAAGINKPERNDDGSQAESTTSEDAVLVSGSDLDDAKSSHTRYRVVTTQKGTVEKHQRLT